MTFMEAIPLTNTAATDVAAALFSGWICRFGVPDTITSDRGPQFTSNVWNSLCVLLQIKHRPTTAYHPQANGMVERLHRRLKDALRTRGASASFPYNQELVRHREKAHNIVRGPKIELDGPCDLVSALRLIFTSATRRRQNASDGSVGIVSKKH